MNTINGNYNYNNYNNYTYTGNLGTGNTGYMNYGNILNNANVNGGAYAAPNTDTSSKGFFSKLFTAWHRTEIHLSKKFLRKI